MKRSGAGNGGNQDGDGSPILSVGGKDRNTTSKESKAENVSSDILAEVEIEKVELKQSIDFFGACSILITNIGGTSIFIAPTTVLFYGGSQFMAILFWIVGGFIQLGMALATIELALLFRKSGGAYFYIHQVFGEMAGFVFLWGFTIFISGTVWALDSYASSLYILSMIWTDCPPPHHAVLLLAIVTMTTVMIINCTYMKLITRIQKFLMSGKLIALLIIIVVGFMHVKTETGQDNLERFMEGSNTDLGSIALGLFAGYFGFGGWQIINIVVEEVKNPKKVLPLAQLTSFTILILAIVTTIFSYGVVLSKEEILSSDAVASQFGYTVHPALSVVLSVLVSLCNISGLNVAIMGQPRMLYAAGHNKQMPHMMTLLHKKFKTPWPATFTLGIFGLIMLLTGDVMSMVSTISLYGGFMSIMMVACILYLRWTKPDLPRTLKVPVALHIFYLVLTMSLMVLSVMAQPRKLGLVVLVVVMGIPIYFVCVKWQRPKKLFDLMDVFTKYLKLCLDLEESVG